MVPTTSACHYNAGADAEPEGGAGLCSTANLWWCSSYMVRHYCLAFFKSNITATNTKRLQQHCCFPQELLYRMLFSLQPSGSYRGSDAHCGADLHLRCVCRHSRQPTSCNPESPVCERTGGGHRHRIHHVEDSCALPGTRWHRSKHWAAARITNSVSDGSAVHVLFYFPYRSPANLLYGVLCWAWSKHQHIVVFCPDTREETGESTTKGAAWRHQERSEGCIQTSSGNLGPGKMLDW